MSFLGKLFGKSRVNEAAQHEMSADILLEQYQAITAIMNNILADKLPSLTINSEIAYFSSLIAANTYMVGAVTAGMRQDDTHYIIEWFMKKKFSESSDFNTAVARHKTYHPYFQNATNNSSSFYQLAERFIEHTGFSDGNTAMIVKITTWLTASIEPVMIKIANLLLKAGQS